ncbi:hypothetical protein K505DRAFT_25511 [Melanomma pulvis-pyrius CBS 109.77]|uniref:Uncharacterized protein n=1 Tax=Melanomma pulvis-pyrius CBS 109.77 TaxID=1314802 RepID=A0A6A6XUK8_9PLEO|nr:hypothetical protein K505DRAFT_25511 [Melanomma pulvis-pyrius CBS 109.77]
MWNRSGAGGAASEPCPRRRLTKNGAECKGVHEPSGYLLIAVARREVWPPKTAWDGRGGLQVRSRATSASWGTGSQRGDGRGAQLERDRAQKGRGSEWTGGKRGLAVSVEDVARGNGGGRRCKRGGSRRSTSGCNIKQIKQTGAARRHSTVAAGGWGGRRAEQIRASGAPEGPPAQPRCPALEPAHLTTTSWSWMHRADKLATPNSNPTSERAVDGLGGCTCTRVQCAVLRAVSSGSAALARPWLPI